ncbi:hypothetical protein [Cyclobacterium sp.]|uniref:hypothetical protein n=1 Tax=Cyclobacterium sp. TaxID=1966343 RepID=UPI0019AD7999|nr:hypothetical protein [Cyclobacterium sp.]MBD3630519.1 hypothetical protein [Cyclobacterium sp.]
MATLKNVIVLQKEGNEEFWSGLKLLCQYHPEFSYEYIKSKKFPFEYKGWYFRKEVVNGLAKELER